MTSSSSVKKFGAPLSNLKIADLAKPGVIFQIGVEPVCIDILTELDGLEFDAAFADLIRNKTRVGRPQDLLDVQKLQALTPTSGAPKAKARRRRSAKRG